LLLAVTRKPQSNICPGVGVERKDVSIQAAGEANSAGIRPAGVDVETGHPGVEKHGAAHLRGAVEVSVDCRGTDRKIVEKAFMEAGVKQVR
jgi:hypothetical protein